MFHGNESRRANLRIAQRQVERSSGQDDMQYRFRLFGERCLASFIRMHFSIDRSRREITKALRQALPCTRGGVHGTRPAPLSNRTGQRLAVESAVRMT